jgi:LemA protein
MLIAAIILIVVVLLVIVLYNGLISKRNFIDNAFASIDVYLKMRHDLIPNLVETVKAYAKHERETLENITSLRNQATRGGSAADKLKAENALSGELTKLLVSVENYPELKANKNFLQLQNSLNEIEAQISAARRSYNAAVTDYNTALEVFPTNLMAKQMRFTKRELLTTPDAERANVDVKTLFASGS